MKTIEDLGRQVKSKYPDYADMSDSEVGRKVKQLYPGQYDDYVEAGLMERSESLSRLDKAITTLTPSIPNLPQLDHLYDLYKPGRGKFTAWWHNRKFSSRAALLENATSEMRLVLEQWEIQSQHLISKQIEEVGFKIFLGQNATALLQLHAEAELLQAALDQGLTTENHQVIKVLAGQASVRLKEAQGLSDIKVDEHQRISDIDLDTKIKAQEARMRVSIQGKTLSHLQEIFIIQELIDTAIDQIAQIQTQPLPKVLMDRKINYREDIIETLKKEIDARRTRLDNEAHNRKDSGGAVPAPVLGKRSSEAS